MTGRIAGIKRRTGVAASDRNQPIQLPRRGLLHSLQPAGPLTDEFRVARYPGVYDNRLIRTKIFLDNLSNSGLAIRRSSEGGAIIPAKDHFKETDMPQFLVS